jgi:hypothetical protein
MKAKRPNTKAVLNGLKDFQRRTVDYVFQRLYVDKPNAKRFLIADEVGLGKTLVARGLIAKCIDQLWSKVDRIDIVYICSNADIARQNINRLNVTGGKDFEIASRITLLPLHLKNLKHNRLNFVSFTPGTSFDLKSSLGNIQERALLYWLLQKAWTLKGKSSLNVLQGNAEPVNFRRAVRQLRRNHDIDESLSDEFAQALDRHVEAARERGEPEIKARFDELCNRFGRIRKHIPARDARDRLAMVGELRGLLAATCLIALQPDLIILDEFQRFKDLLDGTDRAGDLARGLFEYEAARVLLLSATPYKMYSLSHEAATDDHYKDFVRTVKFLYSDPNQVKQFQELLEEYRRVLLRLGSGEDLGLSGIKSEIESCLRRVMVRTEKLASSESRDGMLREVYGGDSRLSSEDLSSYLGLQKISRLLNQSDTLEYWKSAPYLLNFMDGYKLKEAFESSVELSGAKMAKELDVPGLLLDWRSLTAYRAVDPGNVRLRTLLNTTIGKGTWQLLWIPPSLPYYEFGFPFSLPEVGAFTKRLVFSSWRVAPRVIAGLLSYEAERLAIRSFEKHATNTGEARKRRRGLLRFAKKDDRLGGMPVLALMYPCVTLARECDPLKLLGADRELSKLSDVLTSVSRRIDELLADIVPRGTGKAADEAWYWAAPILLDLKLDRKGTRRWLSQEGLAQIWSGELAGTEYEENSLWAEHVAEAQKLVTNAIELGEPPPDLSQVLALFALGGPAIAALRSLMRVTREKDSSVSQETRTGAASVSWAFRRLFNSPEAMGIIRGMQGMKRDDPYWRRVLEYSANGCIQAVIDEYAHILRESLGLIDTGIEDASKHLAEAMGKALSLRTSSTAVDNIVVEQSAKKVTIERQRLRAHFAARFSDEKSDDEKVISRAEHVREAFNSPFWPFVLATTSVGQEGLDFHHFCHAVVHWNLPSNPVDLEQREGRVHRYKGHAVRKNLAKTIRPVNARVDGSDPWAEIFEIAKKARGSGTSDIVPFWVYQIDGGAQIERHVLALPLSAEQEQLAALKRALVVYRMVFGQSRQEDLTRYLLDHVPASEISRIADEMRITLEPS